ncbi:MAG: nuclear transport factor 2 family protein [Chitinophagaceae bacterium]
MKKLITVLSFFAFVSANAQTEEAKVTAVMKEFHQAMVKQDIPFIESHSDKAMTFAHSNGWVQPKVEFIKDFQSGYISYQSYKEDSINVYMGKNLASLRFVVNITSITNGVPGSNHLRVLEVWMKEKDKWVLFARQGVRYP